MLKKKLDYERPLAEIIEFELEESIAYSGDLSPDLACGEGKI